MNTLLKKLTVCHKEKINMTYDNCFDLLDNLKIMFKEGKITLVGEPCLNKSNILSFGKTKEQKDIEKAQILLSSHYKDVNIINANFCLPSFKIY